LESHSDFLWVKVAFGDSFWGMARGKQPTKPAQIDTQAAGGFFLVFLFFSFVLATLIWSRCYTRQRESRCTFLLQDWCGSDIFVVQSDILKGENDALHQA
jgi:hypothetical protein